MNSLLSQAAATHAASITIADNGPVTARLIDRFIAGAVCH